MILNSKYPIGGEKEGQNGLEKTPFGQREGTFKA